jgi:hypothetical protein
MYSFVGSLTVPNGLEEEEESSVLEANAVRLDQPIAATDNYEHVLLNAGSREDYWPFDETQGGGSLYEYSGTGNESPILVGVSGEKGSTQLVGLCGARLAGAGSTYNSISKDGEAVFFTVAPKGSSGCGSVSAPPVSEIYARLHGSLHSPTPAETVHVSESECTVSCGMESGKNFEGANEAGTRVFFTSTQKLTNDAVNGTAGGNATKAEGCAVIAAGNGGCNLYEYDIDEPEGRRSRLVSEGGEVLGVMGIAENGSHVYFVSRSVLAGAGENEYKQAPEPGFPNLYAYDASSDKTAFVATLSNGDEGDWQRSAWLRMVQVAGEGGQFLLFASTTPSLTPDDNTTQTQLFEYDAATAELVRVTKGEAGYGDNGNDVEYGVERSMFLSSLVPLEGGFDFKSTTHRLFVSEDGKTVFFQTIGQLSPRAVSAAVGCSSIYEFHSGAAISEGSVHLISDGRDVLKKGTLCGAQLTGADAKGDNVLFTTADPLLPSDVDGGQRDLYDARVDGGFELPVATQLCPPEECEEAPSSQGVGSPPGSVRQSAEAGVALVPAQMMTARVSKEKAGGKASALRRALRACRARPKRLQARCRRDAYRRYTSKTKVKHSREVAR